MAFSNGAFPKSATTALATAPGQRLEPTAARQWDALARSVQNTYGWLPVLTDSYRPYAVQERIFRDRYRQGNRAGQPGFTRDVRRWQGQSWTRRAGEAAAAVPGTSNHGWAKAVDCSGLDGFSGTRYKQLAALAPRFGFTNTEGRSVGEAWHWVFTGAYSVSKPIGGTGSVAAPNLPGAPAPITKGFLMTLTDEEQKRLLDRTDALYQAMFYGSLAGGVKYPGLLAIEAETQKRVTQVPARVWDTPVRRTGGPVSALQELADAKTLAIQAKGEAAGLRAALDAAAKGQSLTPDQIADAARRGAEEALKGGVKVTIDIPQEG